MEEDHDNEAGEDGTVGYSTEMGGGAPNTGQSARYNEGARIRSPHERTTDQPGSFDEGQHSDEDETLT